MKIIKSCPLGSTCEKIVDDYIEVCHWLVEVQGSNPQTGELVDEKKCAIALIPILQIEQTGKTMQVASGMAVLTDSVEKTRHAQLIEVSSRLRNEIPTN